MMTSNIFICSPLLCTHLWLSLFLESFLNLVPKFNDSVSQLLFQGFPLQLSELLPSPASSLMVNSASGVLFSKKSQLAISSNNRYTSAAGKGSILRNLTSISVDTHFLFLPRFSFSFLLLLS